MRTSTLKGLLRNATLAACVAAQQPSWAFTETQRLNQAEARGPDGRVTVETSVIHVIACNSPGENGQKYYIYRYVRRPGFRAILPPNWGQAIGGRDWPTFEDAALAACRPAMARMPPSRPDAGSSQPAEPPSVSAAAEKRAPAQPDPGPKPLAPSGHRVALVVGNGGYRHATALTNPPNDAADVAGALRDLGFEVIEGRDLDANALRLKVRDFTRKLDGADLGLFFYAGHAVQVAGKNYLVPIDADLQSAADLDFGTIEVGKIISGMEGDRREPGPARCVP